MAQNFSVSKSPRSSTKWPSEVGSSRQIGLISLSSKSFSELNSTFASSFSAPPSDQFCYSPDLVLTAETKRRLDACRDILVGKLPLPTDQIELITLALIYKFMDDLDEESVRLGGKRSFFTGRWRNIAGGRCSRRTSRPTSG